MSRDGKKLQLIIKDCTVRDEGLIACKIRKASSSVNLALKQKPAKFVTQLTDVVAEDCQPSVAFICEISK